MEDRRGPGPHRGQDRNNWRNRPQRDTPRSAGPSFSGSRGAGPGRHSSNRGRCGHASGSQDNGSQRQGHWSGRHHQHDTAPSEDMRRQIVDNNARKSNQITNQQSRRNQQGNENQLRNKRHHDNRDRPMGFRMLEEISQSDSAVIIQRISEHKKSFRQLLDTPVDKRTGDVFAVVLQLVTNVWKSSFEELKKRLLLDLCDTRFIDHLQLYLMQLPYTSSNDKYFNKYYWTREQEFWSNFMSFCECLINVSQNGNVLNRCAALIEGSSKTCLDGLKEKQELELPVEYMERMTVIRENLKVCYQQAQVLDKKGEDDEGEPLESFRQLSVLPSAEELLHQQPYLRRNIVDGAYSDVEHYLDVQFRLLREDCFGPLREGIQEHYLDVQLRLLRVDCFHQFIENPKKRKFDNIRVYRNVKFLEPFASSQKVGSIALLDQGSMKMFKKVIWAHSKRFLFGSLVLFTKDNCRSFLIGTILERDEKYLSKGQIPVNIVNSPMELNMYNDDQYIMIECEVYFEPYYHVLKALQDPSFPEHLAMSKYIVNVEKHPELPAYLTQDSVYTVARKDLKKIQFYVCLEPSWPSPNDLGLNISQYEAYRLALTRQFVVIQGPPGTGKTFLGVKVAETLLKNAPFPKHQCCMLVICYTNHALDQFLEALLPVTKSMARIGGRSRNENLEKFNINNLRRREFLLERKNSSNYHEQRINLKTDLTALKQARARVESLSSAVLSYKSILAYNEECQILENFYRGNGIKDPLKHWLFEGVDNIDVEMPVLELVDEYVTLEEQVSDEIDDENDIYARNDLVIDDLDDDDIEDENQAGLNSVTTSFMLHDKENQIARLTKRLQLLINGDQIISPRGRGEIRDLEREIRHMYAEVKLFKEMVETQMRPPRIQLTGREDLTTIPRIERWSLYFKWANVTLADVKKEVKTLEEKLQTTAIAYEEARMMVDLSVLKKTSVIGMTTTGAARLRKLLTAIAPPIVIVEEAAEVLESHIVTSLTKSCQHLILIGDHQQLRPSAACVRLARSYNLEVSLFERMILNGVLSRRLGVQHRMRPEIAALVSPHIYPELENHPSVEDFPPVRGVCHNLFFFSHDYKEQSEDDSSSRTNTKEADLTLNLANYLMQQDYKPEEVTILAAYSGQLFYMRKQRNKYAYLSQVKITVLDNYQGEESKIILMSLVRNNINNSIGFLGTENRICVALSRAREGFFIFGNIEILKGNSPLWRNIAKTLKDNGSLGSKLDLKCENHIGRVTTISSAADFAKVPEGGCLLECKYKLSCGHPCPSVCHAYDLLHSTIKCNRACEREICKLEGHNCPLKCSMKCEPCRRLVKKTLPCGHTKALPCYKNPDDPILTIFCTEVVTVTLPHCGHEARKACFMKIADVKCKEKCPNSRLSCGHACRRPCHANDDPEHEKYMCMKPCPKAKRGCTAKLEDDLGEHKCLRHCFEECEECNVKVNKKRSNCRHSNEVACHENVDAKPCRSKCARSLPCGHHCKKLCFEKCGDCMQKVKKNIPGCNHEIEVECRVEPTREHCRRDCERVMSCGHVCRGRCDQPCDVTKCPVITEDGFTSPCGHRVRLPCNVHRREIQAGTVSTLTLLRHCSEPCGALLRCGHTCGGSCGDCNQGRLHKPCVAVCHQLNICGHRCEEPCSQMCPPCPRSCAVKCPHSTCGNLCGAPCTPCSEAECGRSCPHSRCGRACGQACDRAPCSLACPRPLPCEHPCRGLCGEPCPPVCRVCDPENFPTDLLGDPYEDDDKLVQLQDCPHILDVDSLDNLMNSQEETVRIKTCPFCRTPIINTYRYKDLVNKLLKHEINPIKEKVYGTNEQIKLKKVQLIAKVTELEESGAIKNEDWTKALVKIHNVIYNTQKNRKVSLLHLEMNDIYLNILETVGQYYVKYSAAKLTQLEPEMRWQVRLICAALMTGTRKISQQQQEDINNELKRLNSIVQLATILDNSSYKSLKTQTAVAEASVYATGAVLTWRVYDEGKAVECLKKLEETVKLSGIVSKEEREMIVKAIGLKAGHWYKCPNGHFYCIGECGGAMVLAKCPECDATIGGSNHTLTAGNRHAGEMDGSRFAAWSNEANNMANFRFD